MKHINKNREPLSLTHYRSTIPSESREHKDNYDSYTEKNELRQSLLTEQGYICCYCMQRISIDNMKIEHWKPQTKYRELQLDYNNLLGACKGGEGSPPQFQYCDTKKGDKQITISPIDNHRNCEKLIKYRADGKIYSDDETINNELNEVLNLNMQTLVNNRKEVWFSVIEQLNSKYPKKDWKSAIKREIQKWSNQQGDGKYRPYCQIVIHHLNKKLSKYP
ncbi:MAG: TIGR02646 family protein [Calothrix sp. MO_167.B12]|nr:TIGR02646 family protein [Calothrix sp. MO_167.B12]